MNSHSQEKIQAFVTRSRIPHLAIGIWHNGNLYQSSYGSDTQPGVDVFETGSIGKTFTATLLAKLVENGVVGLNDRVDNYRPDLPFAKDITLLQLVTHTAGMPNNPFKKLVLNAEKAVSEFTEADYHAFLQGINKPLKTGKFAYSNLGMAFLGNLLADRLGLSYEDAVKQQVLVPLGMTDTHVSPEAYEESRLALGHNGKGERVAHFHWCCMEPAGVWRSTMKDMMIFLKAHLGHSGVSWNKLLHNTTRPAFDEPKREPLGMAWQLTRNEAIGDLAWHNGQTLGQKTTAVCTKTGDSAIMVFSNKIPKLWQYFFKRYSLEQLSFDILESLNEGVAKGSE